jgi:hypothetical protein
MKNLHKIQDELYIIDNNEKVTQNGIWAECSFTGDILKNRNGQYAYKVILTTNDLLIKDGVQAIDDEFLEWFVKNPSCEEVDVNYGVLKPFQSIDKGYMIHLPDNDVLEEPKQLTDLEIAIKLEEIEKEEPKHPRVLSESGNELSFDEQGNLIKEEPKCLYDKPSSCENSECRVLNKCNGEFISSKQETLEEVAERMVIEHTDFEVEGMSEYQNGRFIGIIEGLKWQQERMYSEEEITLAMKNAYGIKYFSEQKFLDNLKASKKKY